jgi:hypothetical protein
MIVRVLLDTCAIRRTLHGYPTPLLDLSLLRTRLDEYKVSIAASAFAELLEQLCKADGGLSAGVWANKVSDIDAVLDPLWPIFPNGGKLAYLTGVQPDNSFDVEHESRYLRAIWQLAREAKAPSDLTNKMVMFRNANGKWFKCETTAATLTAEMQGRRRDWIEYIESIRKLANEQGWSRVTDEGILKLMNSRLGTEPGDPPDLAQRLDSVSRMIANFVCTALNDPNFNPQSEKRRGEAFDIDLLFAIPLPAIVVTADGVFVRRLRRTESPHAKQVCEIDEFNQRLVANSLPELVDSFQSPEKQHAKRSEAAYHRWLARGCPAGDDWADWFAAEPIA